MSIYCWGKNAHGELGSMPLLDEEEEKDTGASTSKKDSWTPQVMPMSHLATSLAAGDGHTLFATESGDVYACGRGKQGQLGLASRSNHDAPTLISDLSHESVVRVAASGVTSYAITATGRVYQWGLVHRSDQEKEDMQSHSGGNSKDDFSSIAAGQLTGLAENQEDVLVHVDVEARAHTQKSQPVFATRQLKDIVTDSTERWMLANDDADAEYYRELLSMGYQKEELDEKMQDRGREYHGMLRIKCKRIFLSTPELISSLRHVKVVTVAAGFAHCVALTDQGVMYSCGYNDRGQLGLGHRISSSEFKIVDYMQGKVVLQVECGQQHSMCRAIERGGLSVESFYDGSGGRVGASVYVWGNGMLGQLGLGLRGTSKGRLLPTLLSTLCDVAPLGAIDISAGGNFSVAVGVDGTVYSWGHAEYNQHGSTMVGGNDYVDNHFYFVPRPVSIVNTSHENVKIIQVSCGSNFTVAVADDGDAYSWGWNTNGVLGHGRGYFGQSAMKIASLGKCQVDRSVRFACAGSNHVLVLTKSSGNLWAKTFDCLLHQPLSLHHRQSFRQGGRAGGHCDMEIVDEASGTVFPCHQVILAARSPYFAGFLRAAARVKNECDNVLTDDDYFPPPVEIFLDTSAASASTIKHLLEYIYTDTLSAPSHKRKQLAELADFVALHRLASLCRHHGSYSDRTNEVIPPSSFESDMRAMVKCEKFSDCKFILHSLPDMDGDLLVKETVAVFGHKVLLQKIPYFRSIFSGEFSDGKKTADAIMEFDMAGFVHDGIDVAAFERLVEYSYTGSSQVLEVEDSGDLMCLLLAANRVGLSPLSQLCEKKLSIHLNDFPENVENCYSFAQMYNIPRLSRQCEELMNLSLKES